MIRLVKIRSKKIDISAFTDSNKSLEAGNYSVPQGSTCKGYFIILPANVCLHACRQSPFTCVCRVILIMRQRHEINMSASFFVCEACYFILLFFCFLSLLFQLVNNGFIFKETSCEMRKVRK